MNEEQLQQAQEEVDPRFGELRFAWTMDEYRPGERGTWWYIALGVVSLACIIWALFTANYAFAVLVILLSLFFLLERQRPADKTPVAILSTGLAVGDYFHRWQDVREFAIVYQPPDIRHVYVFFDGNWRPPLSLFLPEDTDPNEVRDVLKEFAEENMNMDQPLFQDKMKLRYKL